MIARRERKRTRNISAFFVCFVHNVSNFAWTIQLERRDMRERCKQSKVAAVFPFFASMKKCNKSDAVCLRVSRSRTFFPNLRRARQTWNDIPRITRKCGAQKQQHETPLIYGKWKKCNQLTLSTQCGNDEHSVNCRYSVETKLWTGSRSCLVWALFDCVAQAKFGVCRMSPHMVAGGKL